MRFAGGLYVHSGMHLLAGLETWCRRQLLMRLVQVRTGKEADGKQTCNFCNKKRERDAYNANKLLLGC